MWAKARVMRGFTNPRLKKLYDFEIFTNSGIYAGGGSVKSEKGFSPSLSI